MSEFDYRGSALLEVQRLARENESLRAELDCAKAFHDVAVKERDAERARADALADRVKGAQSEAYDALDACRAANDRLGQANARADRLEAELASALSGESYEHGRAERASAWAKSWKEVAHEWRAKGFHKAMRRLENRTYVEGMGAVTDRERADRAEAKADVAYAEAVRLRAALRVVLHYHRNDCSCPDLCEPVRAALEY